MKKLIFAALIMLLASCQEEGFNYFFTITETVEPFCQSAFEFPVQKTNRFEIKDFSEGEAIIYQRDMTFEKIVTKTLDGKPTKAIYRSECKYVLTKK